MKYRTDIFDLDGTLLNTLDDLWTSVNYALDKSGYPLRTIDEVRRFIGNGVRVLMQRAVPEGTDEEGYNNAFNAFREHYKKNSRNHTAPYENVIDMLKELKNRGHKLAIVSNKIDFAVKDLRDEFFDGIVEVAIGDSDDTENKPAPDMVFKALKELNSTVDESVYVGDTDVDLKTAENSGMDCISVSWGFRTHEELELYGAKVIADTAEDVLNLV